ncbi:MAG TPA: thioesterase family protein [bacterium]|nr:thioesterase family protein [bacterium]
MGRPSPGIRGEIVRRVTADLTADRFGNAGVHVLATPMLVSLCEEAALACLGPHLEPGEGSVGTRIELSHTAATPIGMTVRVEAILTQVDGRRLAFDVRARDDREEVGVGRHERFLIDRARFLARVAEKAQSAHNT